MREKKSFAERTKVLRTNEVKKKYFLVFEGEETEHLYFDAIKENSNIVGIDPLIELVPIVRSYSESGWSNPKKIMERILLNLAESDSGTITYETLLNWIMDYFYDVKILSTSKAEATSVWNTLVWVCTDNLCVKLGDWVDNIEITCTQIAQYFSEKTTVSSFVDDIPPIIKNRSITYDERFDKICFIIDRDRDSFVETPENRQFSYVLNTCKDNGFGFYLTNPCFEFWLLLHFDEVKELDTKLLLSNPKVSSKRRYTEQELAKLLPGYSKSRYHANYLIPRIEKAIANEMEFCEDEIELEHSVGSRVGLLMKELKNQ